MNQYAGGGHSGRSCLPRLIDSFWTESRYGSHFCIVSEPLGGSVHYIKNKMFPLEPVPEPIMKRILYDVLLALDYCHRICGVIHTGM